MFFMLVKFPVCCSSKFLVLVFVTAIFHECEAYMNSFFLVVYVTEIKILRLGTLLNLNSSQIGIRSVDGNRMQHVPVSGC